MISIEFYKGLPLKYESFLVEKYDSFYTTCRYLEIYCPTFDINYMSVFDDGHLIDLLIFANRGNTSTCFNSLVGIDQNIITAFTKAIFEKYPSIQKVEIKGWYKEYNEKKSILFSKSNDYIISLPSTMDEYFSELGSKTRQHLKNYKARLSRDFPLINFVTKFGVDIKEVEIDRIIQMNIDRMKYKGITPGRNNSDKTSFYRYSQHYGCASYIEIDGVIVAGCISTILNKRIFLQVISHDNNYSKYNVGQLCILYLIQTSIEKGLLMLHFLWGENEYKKRLLAKPHTLSSYLIYKSYSLDFFVRKVNTTFSHVLIRVRHSKYIKPIRDAIKFYRRKKWNAVTSIFAQIFTLNTALQTLISLI